MSLAGAEAALTLNVPSSALLPDSSSLTRTEIKVHPVVLFSIIDHFLRRPEGQGRVIGTLLGKVHANTTEITNCFAVPHQEKRDEVAVGKDFNKQMLALSSLVNPSERIVGWYATALNGIMIVDNSSLIHEFYTTECESPVHLVVDTSLQNNALECRAYVSNPLEVHNEALGNVFSQLQVSIESWEAERICIDRMTNRDELTKENFQSPLYIESSNGSLESSMERLLEILETTSAFVDKVVKGEVEADPQLGRKIANSLSVVPRMKQEQFSKIFDENLQDLLMVSFLSSLTRTQVAIAEKLSA